MEKPGPVFERPTVSAGPAASTRCLCVERPPVAMESTASDDGAAACERLPVLRMLVGSIPSESVLVGSETEEVVPVGSDGELMVCPDGGLSGDPLGVSAFADVMEKTWATGTTHTAVPPATMPLPRSVRRLSARVERPLTSNSPRDGPRAT